MYHPAAHCILNTASSCDQSLHLSGSFGKCRGAGPRAPRVYICAKTSSCETLMPPILGLARLFSVDLN
eukprot:3372891-Lingulodinium_polyedra.AAC.1